MLNNEYSRISNITVGYSHCDSKNFSRTQSWCRFDELLEAVTCRSLAMCQWEQRTIAQHGMQTTAPL